VLAVPQVNSHTTTKSGAFGRYFGEPQCRFYALTLGPYNTCVLAEKHDGPHVTYNDVKFTKAVRDFNKTHEQIVALCRCPVHPRYGAIRVPRAACLTCWRLYILTHPDRELETRWSRP
jgi:hypothetical protein